MNNLSLMAEESLCNELRDFCEENNLPHRSADEVYADHAGVLSHEKQQWLLDFMKRWGQLPGMEDDRRWNGGE